MSEEAYNREKQDVLKSLRSSILFKITQRLVQIGIDEIMGQHEPGWKILQKEWKNFTPNEIVELSLIFHRLRHLGLALSAKTLELECRKVLLPSQTLASALSPSVHEASKKVTDYDILDQKSEAISSKTPVNMDPVVVKPVSDKLAQFPIQQDGWNERMQDQRDQRIQYALNDLEEKERLKMLAEQAQEAESSDFGSTDSSDEISSPEKTPRMVLKVANPLPSESSSSSSDSTARQPEPREEGSESDRSEKSNQNEKSDHESAKSDSSRDNSDKSKRSTEESQSEAEVEVVSLNSKKVPAKPESSSLRDLPPLTTKPKTEIKIERKLEDEEFSTSDELSINSDDHESKQTSEWLKRMWTTPTKLTTDTIPKSQPKSSIMSLLSTDAPSSSQTAFQARLLGSGSREDVPRMRSPISPNMGTNKITEKRSNSVNVVEVETTKDTDDELEEIGEFDALDAMSDSGSDSISF